MTIQYERVMYRRVVMFWNEVGEDSSVSSLLEMTGAGVGGGDESSMAENEVETGDSCELRILE